MKASGITSLNLTFPIDPGKVKSVKFPAFSGLSNDLTRLLESSERVLSFDGKKGKALYDDLELQIRGLETFLDLRTLGN